MMNRSLASVGLALALLLPGVASESARAQAAQPLAVMPLPSDETGIVASIREGLKGNAAYAVVSEAQTKEQIGAAADLGLTCEPSNVECQAQLGDLAELRWVLVPVVSADEGGAKLDLILVDVKAKAAKSRVSRRLTGGPPADLARDALIELLSPEDYVGFLLIEVSDEGAVIRLDGEEVGISPLPEPLTVRPGQREIEVELAGKNTHQTSIKVGAQENAKVRVDLVEATAAVAPGDERTDVYLYAIPVVVIPAGITLVAGILAAVTGAAWGFAAAIFYNQDLPGLMKTSTSSEGTPQYNLELRQTAQGIGSFMEVTALICLVVALVAAAETVGAGGYMAFLYLE